MIDRLNAVLKDRYLVERELGEGGMATVYLAEDLRHKRRVALKVLKPELAALVGGERFLTEIETTARLQHPNILPLFDSGEADGFLFYVMPYVDGESLQDRLEREKQLPVVEAVRMATEVAEALNSAHGHGVIHRDIKPANIMISQGRPVVADFGIALAVSAAGGHRLTETGLSLGTPHYMSPEQATGDQVVGPASDIYSLGCVLYEMLVGEPPYTGSTAQAILGKVITSEPTSVTEQRRAVPPHVDAVVARALEKLPADRFASAQDFAKALEDEGFRHGTGRTGADTSRRVSALAMAGWGLAAVLAALCLWLVSALPGRATPEVRRLALAVPEDARPGWSLAMTPDGSALVLAQGQDRESGSLYIHRLDDLSRIPIPGSQGGQDPVVSPDGLSVAFVGLEGLRVAPLLGGPAVTLLEGRGQGICCLRWAKDGYVYFAQGDGIRRLLPSGAGPESVISWEGAGAPTYYQPVGNGEHAVVGVAYGGPDSLVWMDRETGVSRTITEGFRPIFLEDRYLVYVGDNDHSLHAAVIDPETGEVLQGPVPLGARVGVGRRAAFQQEGAVALSVSGDLAYWDFDSGRAGEGLVWVDREGEEEGVVSIDGVTGFLSVDVSVNGDRVATSDGGTIWVRDLGRGTQRRMTTYQGDNSDPKWAPDGTSLAFISDRDGSSKVYLMNVEGVAEPELLLEHGEPGVSDLSWSSDGNWLIYRTGGDDGAPDIFAQRVGSDSEPLVVSANPDADETSPTLSPDLRWLAYVSNETGVPEVWVRPFPDVQAGRRQVSAGGATEPEWSGSGEELFFRTEAGLVSLPITDRETFATGRERVLFSDQVYADRGLAYRRYAYDAGRDRFLMVRTLDVATAEAAQLVFFPDFMAQVKKRLGG
jgi:tRNA A-37 threonylcarbamoyl transferase component Bud32